jgi:hypothetical protein
MKDHKMLQDGEQKETSKHGLNFISCIQSVINRVLWTANATEWNKQILSDAIAEEIISNQWIDVNTELPELVSDGYEYSVSAPVLCALSHGYQAVCKLEQYDDEPVKWKTCCSEGWNVSSEVVEWMPLPELSDKNKKMLAEKSTQSLNANKLLK